MGKTKYEEHLIILRCDYCGEETKPLNMRFSSSSGLPHRVDFLEGWAYTGGIHNNNFRVWCPTHNRPGLKGPLRSPLKPFTAEEREHYYTSD